MSKKISLLTFLLFVLSAFVFSTVSGQDMEYKEYKVQKGDTLWDISSKEFEKPDPFLWPKIWKENPEIKNPDLIYPGQIIRIPLKLLMKEQPEEEVTTEKAEAPEPVIEQPEIKKEEAPKIVERKIEPVRINYLADTDLLTSSGYITDYITPAIKSAGKIIGGPSGRTVFGSLDYIYIKTETPVNTGDKFYIIRQAKLVVHPKTREKIGYLIEVPGIAEVVGEEDGLTKAKIIKSYTEVLIGDILDSYYEMEPVMEEIEPRKPDVSGYIVALRRMQSISGFTDIVYIDKGSANGLEVGDLIKAVSRDDNMARWESYIQIISLKSSTATAIVKEGENVIREGDEIRTATKRVQ